MDNSHDDDLVKNKILQDKIIELEQLIKIYKKSYEINIEKIIT